MENLIGKYVTIYSLNYIYYGKLVEVQEHYVTLDDPSIVYETGAHSNDTFKDKQSLCTSQWHISRSCIESFGILENKK